MGLEMLVDHRGRARRSGRRSVTTAALTLVPVTVGADEIETTGVPNTSVPPAEELLEVAAEVETSAEIASDAGMSTVEYAIGTVVAAAFAAVLYRIVTGDSIVSGLTNLVQSALNTNF